MTKIICNPGCLCCACEHQNQNIRKPFNKTVMCYQENGQCVKVVKMEYVMREVEDD